MHRKYINECQDCKKVNVFAMFFAVKSQTIVSILHVTCDEPNQSQWNVVIMVILGTSQR